jgi:hypothetical protein
VATNDPTINERMNEEDALERLTDVVGKAARDARAAQPSVQERTGIDGIVPNVGFDFTGKSPNILSKKARHRLVQDTQNIGLKLLAGAFAVTLGLPLLDALLDAVADDTSISDAWVVPVVGLIIAGVLMILIAYFTVMGFGEVSVSVGTGDDAGEKEANQPDATANQAQPSANGPGPGERNLATGIER